MIKPSKVEYQQRKEENVTHALRSKTPPVSSKFLPQSIKASTLSLGPLGSSSHNSPNKKKLYTTQSSCDLPTCSGGIRSRSSSVRKRKWWFRKGSLGETQHSFIYDRLVSRRLVSAIATWHDIHANLLQLSLNRKKQASRNRKKQQQQQQQQQTTNEAKQHANLHSCHRQRHNHHYHYHHQCHNNNNNNSMLPKQHLENEANFNMHLNSRDSSFKSNNFVEINCQHHCHRNHCHSRKDKPNKNQIFYENDNDDTNNNKNNNNNNDVIIQTPNSAETLTGDNNKKSEDEFCGSLCGMNSICCSSACSSFNCSSVSSPSHSVMSSSSLESSTYGLPKSTENCRTSTESSSSNQLSSSTTDESKHSLEGRNGSHSLASFLPENKLTNPEPDNISYDSENNDWANIEDNNLLQLPPHKYNCYRQQCSGGIRTAPTSPNASNGTRKKVKNFNHSSPQHEPKKEDNLQSSLATTSAMRRNVLRTHFASPLNMKTFSKSFNFLDVDDSERFNEISNLCHTNIGNDDIDDDENDNCSDVMSDETLDEIVENERQKSRRLSLSNPELTAIQIKQMFPDMSEHWRFAYS